MHRKSLTSIRYSLFYVLILNLPLKKKNFTNYVYCSKTIFDIDVDLHNVMVLQKSEQFQEKSEKENSITIGLIVLMDLPFCLDSRCPQWTVLASRYR